MEMHANVLPGLQRTFPSMELAKFEYVEYIPSRQNETGLLPVFAPQK
jgi:hypothetical protein